MIYDLLTFNLDAVEVDVDPVLPVLWRRDSHSVHVLLYLRQAVVQGALLPDNIRLHLPPAGVPRVHDEREGSARLCTFQLANLVVRGRVRAQRLRESGS